MISRDSCLKIVNTVGNDDLAKVYIARNSNNQYLEFVESTPSFSSREKKWVVIISVLYGCPVACLMCDAGASFKGKLSEEEIFAQIDYLVDLYYPNRIIDSEQFKIQFARMGEPTLNPFLLDVLRKLSSRYQAKGLLPSISTVAPLGCDSFLLDLIDIKNSLYSNAKFQMQFSIHTTDQQVRDKIILIDKWNFTKIADYGEKFYMIGDQKIALNFALSKESPFDPKKLREYFNPDIFMIKITPLNPTLSAVTNSMESYFTNGGHEEDSNNIILQLNEMNYDVVLSIGDLEENQIGSNCGQYVQKYIANSNKILAKKAYNYVANC